MKYALNLIALLFLTASLHAQEDLPAEDSRYITAEIKAMMMAFNEGNADLVIKKTHPAIWKLSKVGQENFEKALKQGAKQIMEMGIKIDKLKVEQPTTFYKAGKESVCFVPMSSVMQMKDQKIASSSFMIAAKGEQGEWKYLDGTFVRTNPDQLWTFFPELPKDVQLPETKMELLP